MFKMFIPTYMRSSFTVLSMAFSGKAEQIN